MQVSFRDLGDGTGRVEVTYKDGRQEVRECVPGIPLFLLAAVLISLYSDEDDVARTNLLPVNMAQVRAPSRNSVTNTPVMSTVLFYFRCGTCESCEDLARGRTASALTCVTPLFQPFGEFGRWFPAGLADSMSAWLSAHITVRSSHLSGT